MKENTEKHGVGGYHIFKDRFMKGTWFNNHLIQGETIFDNDKCVIKVDIDNTNTPTYTLNGVDVSEMCNMDCDFETCGKICWTDQHNNKINYTVTYYWFCNQAEGGELTIQNANNEILLKKTNFNLNRRELSFLTKGEDIFECMKMLNIDEIEQRAQTEERMENIYNQQQNINSNTHLHYINDHNEKRGSDLKLESLESNNSSRCFCGCNWKFWQ